MQYLIPANQIEMELGENIIIYTDFLVLQNNLICFQPADYVMLAQGGTRPRDVVFLNNPKTGSFQSWGDANDVVQILF